MEASIAAKKLAESASIDLNKVPGTGKDGLITKGDVERIASISTVSVGIPSTPAPADSKTNIMGALQANRAKQQAAAAGAPAIVAPGTSNEDLIELIKAQGEQIDRLTKATSALENSGDFEEDLTNTKLFLVRRGVKQWQERRVVNGRTVMVDMVGSVCPGPFDTEEDCAIYVNAKAKAREGNEAYWNFDRIEVMTGREARALMAREEQEREAPYQGGGDAQRALNPLEQRIFASNTSATPGGQAKLVGQT